MTDAFMNSLTDSGWHTTFLGYPAGFGQPLALVLCAALLAAGVGFVLLALRQKDRLSAWVNPRRAPRLAPGRSRWRPALKAALSFAGLALLAFALARPQLGGKEEIQKRQGIDVVVALDASRSMLARDVSPDRMGRARLELEALLDQLKGDRVGLVTFAGDAFLQMPLTSDYAAARIFLRAVDPSQMQRGGTDVGGALRLSKQVLDGAEHGAKEKVVVLLTDGEDWRGDALSAARELREAGVKVMAVGIGSGRPEPIPELDAQGTVRGYHKDAEGQTVMTKLDLAGLKEIADAGGGELFHQTNGVAIGEVARRIDAMQKSELEDRRVMTYTERYQAFALPGLLLMLAGALLRPSKAVKAAVKADAKPTPRRRAALGGAGGAAAAVLLLVGGRAHAGVLDAPEAKTEQGRKAYAAGRYDEALKAFDEAAAQHPASATLEFNRGSALYKLGRHEEAKQAFLRAAKQAPGALAAQDRYNLGNALAALGERKEAINAYRKALSLDPNDEQARHNLEVLLKQEAQAKSDSKKDQKQQQAQNQSGQGQKQDDKQNGQGQQQQAQNQSGQGQKQDDKQNGQGLQREAAQASAGKNSQERPENKNGQDAAAAGEPRDGAHEAEHLAQAGEPKPVKPSPGTARILDSMRTSERGLQLWRFQQKSRRDDDDAKDW